MKNFLNRTIQEFRDPETQPAGWQEVQGDLFKMVHQCTERHAELVSASTTWFTDENWKNNKFEK